MIFLAITGLAWILLYARTNSEAKWGQLVRFDQYRQATGTLHLHPAYRFICQCFVISESTAQRPNSYSVPTPAAPDDEPTVP
jgi:hypothetical protein